MNIQEHRARELLVRFGVSVPAGFPAASVNAVAATDKLSGAPYVAKAQVRAGGRGKGRFGELRPVAKGGVRLATIADEVRAATTDMPGDAAKKVVAEVMAA